MAGWKPWKRRRRHVGYAWCRFCEPPEMVPIELAAAHLRIMHKLVLGAPLEGEDFSEPLVLDATLIVPDA